jgi:hypothetical protein
VYQRYIKTRGKKTDYKFILNEPEDKWWRKYKGLTTFEYPTILIENRNNHNPRIYLSGIPSKRKDSKQTIIRYTLVIELDTDTDTDTVLKLVYKWLDEVQKSADVLCLEQSYIGTLLDAQFPEPDVEKLLDKTTEESEKKKILDTGLKKFIENMSLYTGSKDVQCHKYKRWWGGVQNTDSCEVWISLVYQLLKDKDQGRALLLNFANESDVEQLSKQFPSGKIGLLIKNNEKAPHKFPPIMFKIFSNKNFFLDWILTIPPIQYLYSRFYK